MLSQQIAPFWHFSNKWEVTWNAWSIRHFLHVKCRTTRECPVSQFHSHFHFHCSSAEQTSVQYWIKVIFFAVSHVCKIPLVKRERIVVWDLLTFRHKYSSISLFRNRWDNFLRRKYFNTGWRIEMSATDHCNSMSHQTQHKEPSCVSYLQQPQVNNQCTNIPGCHISQSDQS